MIKVALCESSINPKKAKLIYFILDYNTYYSRIHHPGSTLLSLPPYKQTVTGLILGIDINIY